MEPAIQLGYFSVFLEYFAFCLNFIFEWLDFSSHVICSQMAHELISRQKFVSSVLTIKIFKHVVLRLQKIDLVVFLGRNEIKLPKLARDPPIGRMSSNTISLKYVCFHFQKVPCKRCLLAHSSFTWCQHIWWTTSKQYIVVLATKGMKPGTF
jgi:hypothetical protein